MANKRLTLTATMTSGSPIVTSADFAVPDSNVFMGTSNALSTATPASYPAGISVQNALATDGWPRNGLVTTIKHASGGVSQELTNNDSTTGPALRLLRTAAAGSTTWTPWSNQGIALTYQNGWGNFGSGFRSGNAMITDEDMVVLGGVLSIGTTIIGTVITNLPVQMRPSNQHALFAHSAAGSCLLYLLGNGDVTIQTIALGSTWISLNGISFRR